MKDQDNVGRRRFLQVAGAAGASLVASSAYGQTCEPTARQGSGPFYPEPGQSWEDADLTRRMGSDQQAAGDVLWLTGVITSGRNCDRIAGAQVEIWQTDDNGVYKHSRASTPDQLDPDFQYWGRTVTNAEGQYQFLTIVPGKYPGRCRHIHYRVVLPDGRSFVTQLYFSQFDDENRNDGIYRSLLRAGTADSVTIDLEESTVPEATVAGKFDIFVR